MITYEEIGARIREVREKLGMTQADLGRLLTRTRTHAAISDIERGKTRLDIEELSEIAQILTKPLSYFTDPRTTPSVLYRRGDRDLPPARQEETNRAAEAFKRLAREQARRKAEGRER